MIITAMNFLILTSVNVNSHMSLKFMTFLENFVQKTFCGFSAVTSKYLQMVPNDEVRESHPKNHVFLSFSVIYFSIGFMCCLDVYQTSLQFLERAR